MPFSKTGGLADVSGSLPGFIAAKGLDVRVFTPLYRAVKSKKLPLVKISEVESDKTFDKSFTIHEIRQKPPVYFIEQDSYFGRDELYGTPAGDYPDNGDRFAFFCWSALRAMKAIGFRPDIIHGNDWQAALTFAFLKFRLASDDFFAGAKTVFTIHNLAYQGLFDRSILVRAGLPDFLFDLNHLEYYGQVNFLKAGILYSTAVTTVSRKYSMEIQTPEFGCGLDGLLRERAGSLSGILNGVDYNSWNPMTDKAIPANYGPSDLSGKAEARRVIGQTFGLAAADRKPVAGMVTRLAGQKGLDIICEALDRIMELGLKLVILGTGEEKIQNRLKELAAKYPGGFGLRLAFDENLARLIYAGSDILIIPSRYEPCGLSQMYSLKYGTIPVVRATGGLDDTITEYDASTGQGNGFKFEAADAPSLLGALSKAAALYEQKKSWPGLILNAMAADFSWEKSAEQYVRLYQKITPAG